MLTAKWYRDFGSDALASYSMSTGGTVDTSKPLPPGNFGLPFIGETLPFVKDTSTFLQERFQRFGPIFKTRLFGDPVVCFGGHEAFSFFMDDRYFTRRDSSPKHIRELLNPDALPFIHDAQHTKRKRLILQAFKPTALDTYLPALERVIGRFIEKWAKLGSFQWVPELEAMSFALADTLFAGADPDVDNVEAAAQFGRFVDGMLALPLNLPFTTFGRSLKARDQLLSYVDRTIATHRKNPPVDLLAQLMSARDDAGESLSDFEIKIELLHFYFAAHSALYSALSYHLMLLGKHPDAMDRARAEVATEAADGPFTMEVVGRLPYVHQVCLESRRHAGVVPLTFFGTVRETFEYQGHHVPKGWKAFALIASTMRDAKTFTNPTQYDPDRFGPGRAEHQRHANAYVAQGGGAEDSHRCAGEHLANLIMTVFTARILRSYTWELPAQDFGPRLGRLSPTPMDGLKVIFRQSV